MAGGPSAELLEFVGHPTPMDTWEPDDDFRSEEPPGDYDPSYEPDHEYLADTHLAEAERRGEELAEEAAQLAERMTRTSVTRSRWLAVVEDRERLTTEHAAHVVSLLRHRRSHAPPRSPVASLRATLTLAPNAPGVLATAA